MYSWDRCILSAFAAAFALCHWAIQISRQLEDWASVPRGLSVCGAPNHTVYSATSVVDFLLHGSGGTGKSTYACPLLFLLFHQLPLMYAHLRSDVISLQGVMCYHDKDDTNEWSKFFSCELPDQTAVRLLCWNPWNQSDNAMMAVHKLLNVLMNTTLTPRQDLSQFARDWYRTVASCWCS